MMEGPLSKWTNVLQGWQYRWFVLNEQSGTLSYYTSREKIVRGQKRGCVRLLGAIIGINDENDSLFTITVDNQMFHFQARDGVERNHWIRALEITIHRHSGYYRPRNYKLPRGVPVSVAEFDLKIVETDQFLTQMIQQVNSLERLDDPEKSVKLRMVIESANSMLEKIKQGVFFLQMAKSHIMDGDESRSIAPENCVENPTSNHVQMDRNAVESSEDEHTPDETNDIIVPPVSFSNSDDEDDEFFDADGLFDREESDENLLKHQSNDNCRPFSAKLGDYSSGNPEPNYGDSDENFDAICDDVQEQDVGNVREKHGSVLMHLLSQVSVGMDLTKVTLPTFILERRSLLEMYADFFAHPADFCSTTDLASPEKRMLSVVRYYLGAFYAARKSGVAKKPYNPILGETFRCRWTLPGSAPTGRRTLDGPFPGSDVNQLTFVAEQVSHHPPISAFYAENPHQRISFCAHIWTKSSFLGLSIGVYNIGEGQVRLHEHDEDYIVTFPSGYGRSIMTTPWVELGGKTKISCPQTGYWADVEFHTKPFIGGKAHRVSTDVFRSGGGCTNNKPIVSVKGDWNGIMLSKMDNSPDRIFVDVMANEEVAKKCQPIEEQNDKESRRLWKHVTVALKRGRICTAGIAKKWIEQRQRDEAKIRQLKGESWTPVLFEKQGDRWAFKKSLETRNNI